MPRKQTMSERQQQPDQEVITNKKRNRDEVETPEKQLEKMRRTGDYAANKLRRATEANDKMMLFVKRAGQELITKTGTLVDRLDGISDAIAAASFAHTKAVVARTELRDQFADTIETLHTLPPKSEEVTKRDNLRRLVLYSDFTIQNLIESPNLLLSPDNKVGEYTKADFEALIKFEISDKADEVVRAKMAAHETAAINAGRRLYKEDVASHLSVKQITALRTAETIVTMATDLYRSIAYDIRGLNAASKGRRLKIRLDPMYHKKGKVTMSNKRDITAKWRSNRHTHKAYAPADTDSESDEESLKLYNDFMQNINGLVANINDGNDDDNDESSGNVAKRMEETLRNDRDMLRKERKMFGSGSAAL